MIRSTIAVTDLMQIGQQARFKKFEFSYRNDAQKSQLIKREKARMVAADRSNAAKRAKLSAVERWKVELRDAFDYIARCFTPPPIEDRQVVHEGKVGNRTPLIGRLGFRLLLAHGRVLGSREDILALDEYFKAIDPLW